MAEPNSMPQEFCLFAFDHWLTCHDKTQWAAWVQALAAAIAILVTAWFAVRGIAEAKRAEQERLLNQEVDRLRILAEIADAVSDELSTLERVVAGEEDVDVRRSAQALEDLANAIRAIPPLDVPEWGAVARMLRLATQLTQLRLDLLGAFVDGGSELVLARVREDDARARTHSTAALAKALSSRCAQGIKDRLTGAIAQP